RPVGRARCPPYSSPRLVSRSGVDRITSAFASSRRRDPSQRCLLRTGEGWSDAARALRLRTASGADPADQSRRPAASLDGMNTSSFISETERGFVWRLQLPRELTPRVWLLYPGIITADPALLAFSCLWLSIPALVLSFARGGCAQSRCVGAVW